MSQQPPSSWVFQGTCNICGDKMETIVKGGEFGKDGDDIVYVVRLERTEVEAHLLMHDLCTCDWHAAYTLSGQVIRKDRYQGEDCPVHTTT